MDGSSLTSAGLEKTHPNCFMFSDFCFMYFDMSEWAGIGRQSQDPAVMLDLSTIIGQHRVAPGFSILLTSVPPSQTLQILVDPFGLLHLSPG